MRGWVFGALVAFAAALAAAQPSEPMRFRYAPLTPPSLRAHIERLASDEFEGRFPGERGERLTTDYIRRAFEAAGLEPGARDARGRPTYMQDVPLASSRVTNAPPLTIAGADGALAYAYGPQQVVWTKRLEPLVAIENAPLVFVGYGIVDRTLGWNDYARADIAGKIAVILVNDPDFDTGDDRGFGGRRMTYAGRWVYKYEEAARQGAAGALIIHQTEPAAYPWEVVVNSRTGALLDMVPPDRGAGRAGFEGWITEPVARQLFERAGLDFAQLRLRAQRPDFEAVPMGDLVGSIAIETEIREFVSQNVIGVLPGRVRPDEAVLYSAHWDHLGRCPPLDGDDICNGALDNATGVAGLIDLARHFRSLERPRRSLAFIAFTAEEQGLVGSTYYAQNPTIPLRDTVAIINMDGLNIAGPTRDIIQIGGGLSQMDWYLAQAATSRGRIVAPDAFPERGSFYRSDHFPLARAGVPALYTAAGLDLRIGGPARGAAFNRDYVAQRYHRANDEIGPNWNLVGAMQDLQLLHAVGAALANSDHWPQWAPHAEFAAARAADGR